MKFNVKEMVADRIIERIEKEGVLPWTQPWTFNGNAISRHTGKPYSFLNQLMLPQGEYATFNEINKEGGKINKGAKSEIIVFYKRWIPKDEQAKADRDEDYEPKSIPVLRYMRVFNIKDTDLKPKYFNGDMEYKGNAETDKRAEEIFRKYIEKYGIGFEEREQNEAYYRPSTDTIYMPLMKQFDKTAEYYSTLFHEATHSTGHEKRLGRLDMKSYSSSNTARSKEELVAEIGASAILGYIGMDTNTSEKNNAAYVKSWVQFLKNDKKAIVEAAGKAQKAFEMITEEV